MSSHDALGEPRRLLDDSTVDATLRNDLGVSSRPLVDYDLDGGLTRLQQAIASGAGDGLVESVSAPLPGGIAGGLRLVGGLLAAVLVVGGGAVLSMRDGASPEAPSDLARGHAGEAIAAAEARERAEFDALPGSSGGPPGGDPRSLQAKSVAEVAVDLASPVDDGETSPALNLPGGIGTSADATPRPTLRGKKPASSPVDDDALAREIKQLAAARRSLEDDPARTLALAEQGAREFPEGAYVQEREGYAILALVALGRSSEAERRAQRFLARYPEGTMAARVRRAVAE